jgi:transposase
VTTVQASRDLGVHPDLLRLRVKAFEADPAHAFPGHGRMKLEQLEIDRLRHEVTKLKAERDILKKSCGLLREGWSRPRRRFKRSADRVKFAFIAKRRVV